jgi:hypothetical protein
LHLYGLASNRPSLLSSYSAALEYEITDRALCIHRPASETLPRRVASSPTPVRTNHYGLLPLLRVLMCVLGAPGEHGGCRPSSIGDDLVGAYDCLSLMLVWRI